MYKVIRSSNLGKITEPNQSLLDQIKIRNNYKWKKKHVFKFYNFYLLNIYSLQAKTDLFTCMNISFYKFVSLSKP